MQIFYCECYKLSVTFSKFRNKYYSIEHFAIISSKIFPLLNKLYISGSRRDVPGCPASAKRSIPEKLPIAVH